MIRRLMLLLVVAVCAGVAFAMANSTVQLKDGTVLTGDLKKYGSSYSILLPDGSRRMISERDIAAIDGKPLGSETPGVSEGGTRIQDSARFANTKRKADRVSAPIIAITLWEAFLDSNPSEADAAKAMEELAYWQKLRDEGAEKINNKWVGGEELRKLKEEVDGIVAEAQRLEETQLNRAIAKFEEALKKYPSHYYANFRYGYFLAVKGGPTRTDRAIKLLETVRDQDRNAVEVWCNLAALYSNRRRHEEAIVAANEAVELFSNEETVGVLLKTIRAAPRGIYYANERVRDIIDNNRVAFQDIGADGGAGGNSWTYYYPGYFDAKRRAAGLDPGDGPNPATSGEAWSGSGFFITPDGYLITNHHVATGDPDTPIRDDIGFRVRLDDGTEKRAKLIAVDDKADIALMKIKVDSPVEFLQIADDNPPMGSKALVLGYPATGTSRATLQISEGTVKSINPQEKHHVWFDLNTTHGNSGGPIIDAEGRLIAILTGGRTVYNVVYVLGVGPNQIEDFLGRIADKAPKVSYARASETPPIMDAVKLTARYRKATVYIQAIRGSAGDFDDQDDAAASADGPQAQTPTEPEAPVVGGGGRRSGKNTGLR